jgi:type I restriction-modification system DNA methylase subunit
MKVVLKKDDRQAISQFTGDIVFLIEELNDILNDIYVGFYKQKCGYMPKATLNFLFDEWLTKNMSYNMEELRKILEKNYNQPDISKMVSNLKVVFKNFQNKDEILTALLVNKRKNVKLDSFIDEFLFKIFRDKIEIFIDQTSIQFVGRFLMLFVGIDKNAWNMITTPTSITNRYIHFYWIIRNEMYKIIPSIYNLNELDWVYIPDTIRQSLSVSEIKILESYEYQLDVYLNNVYSRLNNYDYSNVNSDIWKSVYQKILPKEQTNKLGFVHTPDEIVDSILDMVGYIENSENLCNILLLDPACGSGTFLVNALTRLINHLNMDLKCHSIKRGTPEWLIEEKKLKIILNNLHGIDINPFATFLTTLNLTFMLMDSFSVVHSKNPSFRLDFQILTNDTLAEKIDIPKLDIFTNSRKTEAIEKMLRFSKLLKKKFDIIIGNPPWGIVLKGELGPLGDESRRIDYKKRFHSAVGKYDIYVLFMERSINLLAYNGVLGFITQIMYVSQDYGEGIKDIIKEKGNIEIFVDLSTLGKIIFPGFTNYPAITIFKNGEKQKEIRYIKVTKWK